MPGWKPKGDSSGDDIAGALEDERLEEVEELEPDGGGGVGATLEEDDCGGRLDWEDKQSCGQAFGLAFSNSSQILSPHLPTCSIGGFGSGNGAGFLKMKYPPMTTTTAIIIKIIFFML